MPNSVLDAIKLGIWDFEPETVKSNDFDSTSAMPGTRQKLDILAERIREGMPLWHPSDRSEYDDPTDHLNFEPKEFAGDPSLLEKASAEISKPGLKPKPR